jgi:hypothetical protein
MPSDLAITGAWRLAWAQPRDAASQAAPASVPGASAVLPPNPSARFDAKDWIVILEFHDDAGNVTYTIPSPRKLAALDSAVEAAPES